jgi:hypothetical protein
MDKSKQTISPNAVNSGNSSPDGKKKGKITREEQINQIEIKSIEKDCLERVFNLLTELRKFHINKIKKKKLLLMKTLHKRNI